MKKKFDIKKILPIIVALILALFGFGKGLIGDNGDTPIETSNDTTGAETQYIEETTGRETDSPETAPPSTKKDETEAPETKAPETKTPETEPSVIDKNGKYTTKEDVALYIHTYGKLPSNFVTKKTAKAKGWQGGSLEKYYSGCSIGGDYFGNAEGLLPKKKGRTYYECDIDTMGKKSRGEKRIVYSNDGLIYYTGDHYQSYTLLYGGK